MQLVDKRCSNALRSTSFFFLIVFKRVVQKHCIRTHSKTFLTACLCVSCQIAFACVEKRLLTASQPEVSTGQEFLSCPASYIRPGGRQDRTKTKNVSCPALSCFLPSSWRAAGQDKNKKRVLSYKTGH